MENILKAMNNLSSSMSERDSRAPIAFDEFFNILAAKPSIVIRNVFQVFHDMIKSHVGEGHDEYPDDPESINYVYYDFSKLFVDTADYPFFADRIFANRIMNLAEALRRGAQQNKIYIFAGPPGCGKSTFLNNLLKKFEEYTHTEDGIRYETFWRIDPKLFGAGYSEQEVAPVFERLCHLLENRDNREQLIPPENISFSSDAHVEIQCPSHDNPILLIPKNYRRSFFDDLFENDEFKWNLYTDKEYSWVFRDNACTICSTLYSALLEKLQDPMKVFKMIYAQPYSFNRRLGVGISVFNPGDKPIRHNVLSNPILQRRIDGILKDSNRVQYLFSRYAKTNNGIYALMDIKSHNTERLIELHNIVSEGVHKVDDIEESVNSLFLAVMNPEDKPNVDGFKSFLDRIEYITIPYVMDLSTEVEIYRNIFGSHIDHSFLPRVLENFARVIIASRLKVKSEALLEWIGDPDKYRLYCDKNLQLLKMEIYAGNIPSWLSEEDRKKFTAQRRRRIIAESDREGDLGISGRDSIKLFNEFYSSYAKEDHLINMSVLCTFFRKLQEKSGKKLIPEGFLESLLRMYNFTILQEVKESLYYYNEEQISKDIQNYMFAVNFEVGSTERNRYTGQKIEITDEYLDRIELRLLGKINNETWRRSFRKDTQKEYAAKTLTQEIMVDGKDITETSLYQDLFKRYVYNLKEKVLDPFLENENFRRAIKDFGKEDFKAYDKRIQEDVVYLMDNLYNKYNYSKKGAKEVCIYVIDNDLARKFTK